MIRTYLKGVTLLGILCALLMPHYADAQSYVRYVEQHELKSRTAHTDSALHFVPLPKSVAKLDNYPKINVAALELSQALQNPGTELLEVWVCGSASPEGSWDANVKLSKARTDAAAEYIKAVMDIPDYKICRESLNEDWYSLYRLVEENYVPYKYDVLHIIRNKQGEERKTALKKLDGGRVWDYLAGEYFPKVRGVRFIVICKRGTSIGDADTVETVVELPQPAESRNDTIYIRDTVYCIKETVQLDVPVTKEQVYEDYRSRSLNREAKVWDTPWMMGVKTNLLSDAMLVPTVGLEVQLGKRLSLDIQGWNTDYNVFNPSDGQTNFYGFSPELRLWLGNRIMRRGSFVGVHARCAWYTMQWTDGLLYQNGPENVWIGNFHDAGNDTPAWSLGVTYGYSLGFGQKGNWGLEFVLGVGYANYKQNTAAFNEGIWEFIEHQDGHHVGITRIGVNLTYRFSLRKVKPEYYENN